MLAKAAGTYHDSMVGLEWPATADPLFLTSRVDDAVISVFFARGSDEIDNSSDSILTSLGSTLRRCEVSKVILVGSASMEPYVEDSDRRNLSLAWRRAQIIKEGLISSGLPEQAIEIRTWDDFDQLIKDAAPTFLHVNDDIAPLMRRVDIRPGPSRCDLRWRVPK